MAVLIVMETYILISILTGGWTTVRMILGFLLRVLLAVVTGFMVKIAIQQL
jgi:hypothetical protein